MQANITQATQEKFATIVQKGLLIGVELSQKAFAELNVKFFEDAVADQKRMLDVATRNISERVSFEDWLTRAREFDFNSNIIKYDVTGQIQELNDELFNNYAQEYYDNYVVPHFDTPLSALENNAAMSIQSIQAIIGIMNDGLTEDDQLMLNAICDNLSENVSKASTTDLLTVISPNE